MSLSGRAGWTWNNRLGRSGRDASSLSDSPFSEMIKSATRPRRMSGSAAKRNAVRHCVEQCIFPVAKRLNAIFMPKDCATSPHRYVISAKRASASAFSIPAGTRRAYGTQHGYPARPARRAGKGARQVRAQVARFRSVQIKAARMSLVKAGYIQSGFCVPAWHRQTRPHQGSQPCGTPSQ